MKYSYAWATITGKVFVSEDELQEKIKELHPDSFGYDDEQDLIDNSTLEQQKEAFEIVAREKLAGQVDFSIDEPMKVNEVEIDLETYHS